MGIKVFTFSISFQGDYFVYIKSQPHWVAHTHTGLLGEYTPPPPLHRAIVPFAQNDAVIWLLKWLRQSRAQL